MRRACFLVDRFYGPTAIERRARLEVRALVDAGARVTVVTARWDDPHDDLATHPAVELVEVPRRGRRSVTQALWLAASSTGPVRRSIAGADLLVAHGSPSLVPALPVARRRRVPAVFVVHSLIQDRLRTGDNPHPFPSTTLYRATDRIAARAATHVVGVSRYIADVAVGLGAAPARTHVLHNPVDVERFHPGPEGGAGHDVDVLFVGRLTVDKGIDDLLAAAALLGPDVSVAVIGPGTRRAALEAGAPPHVRFLGRVDNDRLPALITRARLLAVPSRNEPQGVAVLEGLACGTPVVGCRVGGIPEMVEHGVNGWLVPPHRPDALAAAIRSALDDPGYADVRRRARASAERFAAADFPAAVTSLYEGMVRTRPR
ncbi:MAG: glycosyltransferase family 4 protein [Acidimicrobiales bacterium]